MKRDGSSHIALNPETARLKIEAYCAYQERCRQEVRQKLQSWGLDEAAVADLVSHLEKQRFLDEQRFAEAYAQGKLHIKRWGRNKIRLHLRQKGLTDPIIRKAFETLEDERYFTAIDELIAKKMRELKSGLPEWQKRGKITQYLLGKGFEVDLIQDRLKAFGAPSEADD